MTSLVQTVLLPFVVVSFGLPCLHGPCHRPAFFESGVDPDGFGVGGAAALVQAHQPGHLLRHLRGAAERKRGAGAAAGAAPRQQRRGPLWRAGRLAQGSS